MITQLRILLAVFLICFATPALAAERALITHWAGARFPETVRCATDRIDGGRAWTERMGWNRV
jgi:hypothetical protein